MSDLTRLPLFAHSMADWQPPADGTPASPMWQTEDGAFREHQAGAPALPICSKRCPWFQSAEVERAQRREAGEDARWVTDATCFHDGGSWTTDAHDQCWPAYSVLWRAGAEVFDDV